MIEKSTDIPLYQGKLVLLLASEAKEVQERINDFKPLESGKVYASAHPFSFNEDNLAAYAIILNMKDRENKITHGTIAHEAMHIVSMVLEDRGVIADFNNDEPAAYLLTWVVDKIYSWLIEVSESTKDESYGTVYSS